MPAVATAETLGRFELKRELGKGAQATVWLAFDPRLEREVAVKLMRLGADASVSSQWLQEARSVSRLNHPHIVPVFEGDMHHQQPYLVFEYVPGRTLTAHLRARGALPVREAVEMMVGVLDALEVAHQAGVVHRDLKPSNILVDGQGRGRVMDFGIAARLHDPSHQQQVVGTPGYMSPEATHGLKPSPGMDVFSAGLVLAEMLSGQQLVAERDPFRAMYRVAHEDRVLPESTPADVDDRLRAIVLRSLARDPSKRFARAAEFADALRDWLAPAPGEQPQASGNGTLDFLLRRMRHKSDFPALSNSVGAIQRVANSENERLSSLSGEILKDVALTNKLLRMVNTASFRHAGGGTISTVSRAVALVGFAGIRNMALSLVLLEHMNDKAHASQLKEEFLRSLMAASLANELCGAQREGEEAFIGAIYQSLGRLLTEFYFPEEARQVRSLVAAATKKPGTSGRTTSAEEAASITVLGLSFEELGLGIARSWGLPENLQRCMRRPTIEPPGRPCDKADRIQWIATVSNELTDALLKAEPGHASTAIAAVAERYGKVLGLGVRDVQAASVLAQQRLAELAQAMNLHVQPGSPMRRLLEKPGNGTGDNIEHDSLTEHALQATIPVEAAQVPFDHQAAIDMLAAGIQDITNTMVEDFKLNEVLRMILETMLRALGFRRVIFCLRDPKCDALTGRFGLGEGVEQVSAKFKVPLKTPAGAPVDLFGAVCLKGADTLISDATLPQIAGRLPVWYKQGVNAPAFLLLPLLMKGAPFALIYADKARPGAIELGEKELSLLRTLRNQAVMAFKQAS
ncbi:serine/threonine protein kinase [Piscinibacter sp. HJYY11]|uniref:serine/threonine protein kinase n=1 Tax=Piscinibacter sp. HJYY11 TaxID=2801333 RepID=UPI00191D97C1|nr:serine/threonine protein kinase [Piscinibacter sp. HJYY11]MBL0731118.1 protein kinase [Piscinibacter sp. HJYY11]